ncbi:MAG: hypothetical protein ACWGQW_02815 [bacterium]
MPVKKEYRDYMHICVCVPNTGTWRTETAKSMALMFSHVSLHGVPGVTKAKITMLTSEGSMVGQQREVLTAKVLQSDATHLLFIDSDMGFPMTTARDLALRGKEFVAANCTTRTMPPKYVAHALDGEVLDSRGMTGVTEAQHVGLAVALIETAAIKRLKPPLYLMDWIPSLHIYCGEDVYFTQLLARIGVKIFIDHDLSQHIVHVGSYAYSHKDLVNEQELENVN